MEQRNPESKELRAVVEVLRSAYRAADLNGIVSIICDHIREALPSHTRDPALMDATRVRMTKALSELCAANDQGRRRAHRLLNPEKSFRDALELAADALDKSSHSRMKGDVLRAAADGLLDAALLQCERASSEFSLTLIKDLELLGAPPSLAYATDGALIWQNSALTELIEHRRVDRRVLLTEARAFAEPLCTALARGEVVKTDASRKQRGSGMYLQPVAHRSGMDFTAGAVVVQVSELRPSTGLTPRELQAVRGICAGMAYREAADAMGISLDSVRTLVRRAYRKLGVHNRVAVKARLAREGLLAEEDRHSS